MVRTTKAEDSGGSGYAAMIDIDGLVFSYGDHRVLDGISYHAQAGETVCLLGCNGAGKSTLFRCLLGLLTSYQGIITIDGVDIRRIPRKELSRKIAYIPQSSSPMFDYSVFDVVCMGRSSHMGFSSVPSPEDERIVFEVLDDLGIGHLATDGYAHISGGERQMVLIARALAQQASIVVMDEPTANLDFGNQHRVLEEVRHLKESGLLVIMASHNPQHALSYATKVIVIKGGKLIRQGSPKDVCDEALLKNIYGIDVEMIDVERKDNHEKERICIPL
jgi:iron complex transport system ATP-binding protein